MPNVRYELEYELQQRRDAELAEKTKASENWHMNGEQAAKQGIDAGHRSSNVSQFLVQNGPSPSFLSEPKNQSASSENRKHRRRNHRTKDKKADKM